MDRKIQASCEEKIDLNRIPVGIILTDEMGIIRRMNCHAVRSVGGQCMVGTAVTTLFDIDKTRSTIGGEIFSITVAPLEGGDFRGKIYLLQSLEDVLQEESERKARETLEMVAEIAHEIRNPLGSIELLASLLRKTMRHERDVKRMNQIILSVKTINERISELLRLSKKRTFRNCSFSLNRLLLGLLCMPGQTESFLTTRLAAQEMVVYGDEKMLHHMFLNLLIQMLQIMPSEAGLIVEMTESRQEGKSYAEVTFMCSGEQSIFTNFDLALGLNLAIIHHITQMHNGIVHIGSHALSILLPVTES